jgi:hypothetical protein
MAAKFFKDLWWILSEGLGLAFVRWAEGVSAHNNAYRPVSKIKNTPVSGDALAWHRKEWRNHSG